MAETSGPFDAADLTEGDWEQMLQHVVHGVIGGPGSSALSASPSSSLARGVDINIGNALMLGHWYRNSAIKTLQSSVNGTSSPRIDRAVLRLDRTANTLTVEKIEGTAGGQAPTPTNTATVTETPVHRWTIGPGGTAATSLTDERPFLGSLVVPCTSTNRPLNPFTGMVGYETDTGRWIGWTGSTWRVISEETDSGDILLPIGLPTRWKEYSPGLVGRRRAGLVTVEINVQRIGDTLNTDNSDDSGGSLITTLPAVLRPVRQLHRPVVITGGMFGRIRYQTDGGVYLQATNVDVSVGRFVRFGHTFQGA